MFRPFRLVTIGALALAIYAGFFALPGGGRTPSGTYDADQVANYEVEAWKAAKVHNEFSVFLNMVLLLREQHQFTWFRAVQEGYYGAKALNVFSDMTGRYERIMPDLEDAADVERAAKGLSFDPAAVARAQLNWMVTARLPDLNATDQVAAMMAEDYGLRYGVRPDQVFAAAAPRAEAFKMWMAPSVEPDYPTINKLLIESHRTLRLSLQRARAPRPSQR